MRPMRTTIPFSNAVFYRKAPDGSLYECHGSPCGAPVRFAGVDLGSVKSVRAKPKVKNSPVEVVMVFNPPYELKIPNDSTVLLETAGILGETFVDIDAASATGPPIGANAVLKAKPTVQLTTEQFIEKLSDVLGKKNCDCDNKKDAAGANAAKKSPSMNP